MRAAQPSCSILQQRPGDVRCHRLRESQDRAYRCVLTPVPRAWLLAAAPVLAALQLAGAGPAAADDGSFTITSRPAEGNTNEDYFQTAPQSLDSADVKTLPRLGALINGPRGKEVQGCVRKCVPTCINGGQGAPGLGPMTMRGEMVVFKDSFRSRKYCLSECTQVCALTLNPPAQPAEAPGPGTEPAAAQ